MAHAPQPHATGTGRILQKEISGVAASEMGLSTSGQNLVPDGVAPRTQESHSSTLGGLGARKTSG